MNILFRSPAPLLQHVRTDLHRVHAFAAERVGFLSCRAATAGKDLLMIAASYHPVADEDYIDDMSVGALIGSAAFRKAFQISLNTGASMFHVHMHEHRGQPRFSQTDLRESSNFMPDFFNVSPTVPHGALLLSYDAMIGICWTSKTGKTTPITQLSSIGAPMRFYSGILA